MSTTKSEQVEPLLGKGNFGRVVRVKDANGQVRACKTVQYGSKPNDQSGQSSKNIVEREIEILSAVNHNNIVRYIDAEWGSGEVKIYMEYCDGGSMQDYLDARKGSSEKTPLSADPVSEELILRIILHLASALMYCHYGFRTKAVAPEEYDWNPSEMLLHRDIKPGNVLFVGNPGTDQNFISKLGDFGLGVILTEESKHETYVGTPQYGAPELHRANIKSGRLTWTDKCDIFSLGCTLYALCNFMKYEPPFNYRMEETEKAPELSDTYSESLRGLIAKCIEFSPELRPDSREIHDYAAEKLKLDDSLKLIQTHRKGHIVIPGTAIAAVNWAGWHYRVYFQDSSGGVREARHDEGVWSGGDRGSAIFKAKLFTPLAAVCNEDGTEIDIFYLSDENIVHNYCYTSLTGWHQGNLHKQSLKAAPNSKIGAVWLEGNIHIYFQEPGKNEIQEYSQKPAASMVRRWWRQIFGGGSWKPGTTLQANAIKGTSISAATWGGGSIRVYYQDTDLELREHCCDGFGRNWYVGHLGIGRIPELTSISALGWMDSGRGGIQLRIYWHGHEGNLMELKWSGGWHEPTEASFMGITSICAVQWSKGDHIRVYYQGTGHAIQEKCHEIGNPSWYGGSRVDAVNAKDKEKEDKKNDKDKGKKPAK